MRAIKTNGWKLIEYDVLEGTVRQTQMFDLRNNPNELLTEHNAKEVRELLKNAPEPGHVNLAVDPRFVKRRSELQALLKKEMKRLGDPYTLRPTVN